MVVMNLDTFDVENKEVSSQFNLMKNAIVWTIGCCYTDNTGNYVSISDFKTGIVFYLHSWKI